MGQLARHREKPGPWTSRPDPGTGINNLMENDDLIPFPSGELMYKTEAAKFLGISLKTLEGYVAKGTIKKWKNKINGRTYYDKLDLLKLLGSRIPQKREVIVYCRAAGIPDLGRNGVASGTRLSAQRDRVMQYCAAAGIRVDRVIEDIGKAGSLKGRPGFSDVLEAVVRKKVSTVIIETPDRLARFGGADIIEQVFAYHGVELHVISKYLFSTEQKEELKDDLAQLILESRALLGES